MIINFEIIDQITFQGFDSVGNWGNISIFDSSVIIGKSKSTLEWELFLGIGNGVTIWASFLNAL